MTVAPKIGAVIGTYRLLSVVPVEGVAWSLLIAVVAAVTMTVGNLAALWQDDVRRLLGWSSVSQAGYALMPLVAIGRDEQVGSALVIFLLGYAAAQMAAFGVVIILRGRTQNWVITTGWPHTAPGWLRSWHWPCCRWWVSLPPPDSPASCWFSR